MATTFKNRIINAIGTDEVSAITTTPSSRVTVIGLSLANLTPNAVSVSVTITDDTSTTGYFVKDVLLPPTSSLRLVNGGEKLILAPDNEMRIVSSQANSIDAVISYVEIT